MLGSDYLIGMTKSYMKNLIIVLVAVGMFVAAGIALFAWRASEAPETAPATLTGTVTYRERIALLPGSVVEVVLEDVSRADAPSSVLARTEIVTQGENVPIPFTLTYDPDSIEAQRTYAVSARILQDGALRWTSDTHIPVFTDDAPSSDIEIMLVRVADTQAQQAPAIPTVALVGTTFRLSSYNGTEIPRGTNYTLTLEADRLSARFCNSMSGAYTLSNGILHAPQMVSTLMACTGPTDPMALEHAFGEMVAKGAALVLLGTTLTLASADGTSMTFVVFMD